MKDIEIINDVNNEASSYGALPVVALRGIVVFPGMSLHFDVGRKKSIEALQAAMENDQRVFLVAQKDIDIELPTPDDLYNIGIVAKIRQMLKPLKGTIPYGNIRDRLLFRRREEYPIGGRGRFTDRAHPAARLRRPD